MNRLTDLSGANGNGAKIICEFEIPAGTTADIILPGETIKNATGILTMTL